ncbi:hypothetical protein ACW5CM_14705 [Microbacterium sp. A588]
MDDAAFESLYGSWAPRTSADAAQLFDGYSGTWWIAGGWALEAFTGVRRHHEDIDPSVLRAELPLLRDHLIGRLHVWAAFSGALKPLIDGDRPNAPAEDLLPDGCGQLWVRPNTAHRWEYDILLSPGSIQEWVYKRDDRPVTDGRSVVDARWHPLSPTGDPTPL